MGMGKRNRMFQRMMVCCMVSALFLSEIPLSAAAAASRPALSAKKISLTAGEKVTLKIKKVSKRKIKRVRFSSSNKQVAQIHAVSGKVTARRAGAARITCRLTLKNKRKYSLTCLVKVKNSADTQEPAATASADQSAVPAVSQNPAPVATQSPAAAVTQSPAAETPEPGRVPDASPAPEHLSANGIVTIDNGQMREGKSAFDIQHDMGLGINLGNTMEPCGSWINDSSVSSFEQAWGAPVTTQEMITGMRKAGFRSIRIPVAWSNRMSEDGSYTIDEEYFDRVEEIMNYAFRERMYVIVNIHYDGGWWARFGSQDEEERTQAMVKYKAIWTQIANRYREYSDYLIFESANEELGEGLNATDQYENSGYFKDEDGKTDQDKLYELTNEINQTFVDIVRGSGGNNAVRHLLIAGYDTNIARTCDGRFRMPSDTIADHLMISIHFYSPSTFCLAEDENNSWGYRAEWGTEEDIASMKSELSHMKITFANRGVPVVIGEYGGACNTRLSDGSYQRKKGRALFFKTLCEYALDNGMCPMLWDIQFGDPDAGIYDRLTCEMVDATEAADFLTMAEKADSSPVYQPLKGKDTLEWNGTIGCAGWNPVAPVAELEGCDFVMTGAGGCYQISGVRWAELPHPVLTVHSDTLTDSVSCEIARVENVNTENQYYFYIQKAEAVANGSPASGLAIDLSELHLSDSESLFICFKKGGSTFQNAVRLILSGEKS